MESRYGEVYAAWRADPQAFWAEAAKAIDWIRPPQTIFDSDAGVYGRWFPDATLNACFNAVDRHVAAGKAGQVAIYYDSPVTRTKRRITYRELLDEVATLAAALVDLGVGKGDRVIVYMPMIPEAVFAMLACARIGAVHSVVFGGFAAKELATRIDDAEPKLVLTASCGVEPGRLVEYKPLLDLAIGLAKHKPQACVVLAAAAARRQNWSTGAITTGRRWSPRPRAAGKRAPCVELAATDPLYILYTSGTTGMPKGVVRDIGGYCVALKWTMSAIYGVEPGETYWAASDIGWVVGHSYIVYAPLLHGCATVLYEGKPVGTPDAAAFWRVIEEYQVAAFFTAPTAFRAVRKEDPRRRTAGRLFHRLAAHPVPRRRARRSRHRRLGGRRAQGAGGRPLVADRDRLGDLPPIRSGSACCRSSAARRPWRCRATKSRWSTRPAIPCRPARWARSSSSCRCRPAACRRSIARTSGWRRATSPTSPATTRPPTPASRTRTAT